MENKDIRKLSLYSADGKFDTTVEAVTLSCAIHMLNLPVKRVADITVLKKKPEGLRFAFPGYQCILERESSLREFATLVGGTVPILRFLYASEIIAYDWYPQNPLDRAKLDQFFDWLYRNKTAGDCIRKSDLKTVERYFIGNTQPYLIGMHEMTFVDVVAFFAIMPAHADFFDGEEARRIAPKLSRWVERLTDNEDLMEYLQSHKIPQAVLAEAQEAPRPKL